MLENLPGEEHIELDAVKQPLLCNLLNGPDGEVSIPVTFECSDRFGRGVDSIRLFGHRAYKRMEQSSIQKLLIGEQLVCTSDVQNSFPAAKFDYTRSSVAQLSSWSHGAGAAIYNF